MPHASPPCPALPCPAADFFLDLISVDHSSESSEADSWQRIDFLAEQHRAREGAGGAGSAGEGDEEWGARAAISSQQDSHGTAPRAAPAEESATSAAGTQGASDSATRKRSGKQRGARWHVQLWYLMQRTWRQSSRDVTPVVMSFASVSAAVLVHCQQMQARVAMVRTADSAVTVWQAPSPTKQLQSVDHSPSCAVGDSHWEVLPKLTCTHQSTACLPLPAFWVSFAPPCFHAGLHHDCSRVHSLRRHLWRQQQRSERSAECSEPVRLPLLRCYLRSLHRNCAGS